MKLTPRVRALSIAVVGLLALSAAPANAATSGLAAAGTCGAGTHVFSAWNDTAGYVLASNGDLEAGGAAWALTGGAAVVSGGDPFALGGKLSAKALWLPGGGAALSPSSCIAADTPTFRLLARNQGAATSKLRVEVVFGPAGSRESKAVADLTAGAAWAPTKVLSLALNKAGTATTAQFRFTPLDTSGRWQIDSVYIDPYLRR
jgi:hypothetical protein